MNYIDYIKKFDNFDKYIIFMKSLGFTDESIALKTGITRQTVWKAKKRMAPLLETLENQ